MKPFPILLNSSAIQVQKIVSPMVCGREQIEKCFTSEMCYWFAFLLANRFPGGEIVYDEVANHFGCEIGGQVYDITGNVTNSYNWMPWLKFIYKDTALTKRVVRDCILKLPVVEED